MSTSQNLRRFGAAGLATAVVAAGALVPAVANADADPSSRTISFDEAGLAASGWNGAAVTNPSNYDVEVVDADTLRVSNWTAGNDRGVIQQLQSPTVQDAGEPGATDASNDSFTASFTLDSAVDGYVAQPGLAIELDADHDGNRAGGGVTFRVVEDQVLEISNYYSLPGDLGDTWRNDIAEVAFTGPLDIEYSVHFVAGGADVVTVSVDGTEVLNGGSFEGYTLGASGHAGTVDGILLRAVSREPGTSPSEASWNTLPLSAEQNADLQGKGLLFSDISYGVADSGDGFASESSTVVPKASIDTFEDAVPSSPTFNYENWHVTRADGGAPEFDVEDGVLEIKDSVQNGRSVQLLKGFPSGSLPTDLRALVAKGIAWDQPAGATAEAYFQLPVFRIVSGSPVFAGTLYPVTPAVGLNVVDFDDLWKTTRTFGDYTANTAAPLGDIIDALGETYVVAGFGVAAGGATGAAVTPISAIYMDGVKYSFSNLEALAINPTISGELKVGKTLTAVPNSSHSSATFAYQWYRDGAAITGAKSKTYTLTSSDRAHAMSVKVSATKAGFTKVSKTSAKTAKVGYGTIVAGGPVTITGTLEVGQKLTAVKPSYDRTNLTVKYQWYRGATAISGATGSTRTLTSSDLGAAIKVKVTVSKTGYTSLSVTSDATSAIQPGVLAVSKVPTISGTAKVGKTLTASSSGWNTTSVSKKYAWYADGELIKLSSSNTLKLSWEEKGAVITVKVIGSKFAYLSAESGLSAATGIVK